MDIIWSKDAGDELFEIISFIKYNTGKLAAKKINDKINEEIKKVSKNAAGRRIAPMFLKLGIKHIHQFNINPWAVFYKVENNIMEKLYNWALHITGQYTVMSTNSKTAKNYYSIKQRSVVTVNLTAS